MSKKKTKKTSSPTSPETDAPDEPVADEATDKGAEVVEIGSADGDSPEPAPPEGGARVEDLRLGDRDDEEEIPEEPDIDESAEIEADVAEVEELPEAMAFTTPAQVKAALECLLFTTPHALSEHRLRSTLGDIDLRTLRGALTQLQAEYDARRSGLQVIETAEGYQMCTRPEFANVVLRLHRQRKKNPLTASALETLAIVAYKQPVTRAEVEIIRGVESSGVLRNLCDMGLVKVVGRKEVVGRPQLYGTTSIFLRTFGLTSLKDLPTIQELRRQYGIRETLDFNRADDAAEDEGEDTAEEETQAPPPADAADTDEPDAGDDSSEPAEAPDPETEDEPEEPS